MRMVALAGGEDHDAAGLADGERRARVGAEVEVLDRDRVRLVVVHQLADAGVDRRQARARVLARGASRSRRRRAPPGGRDHARRCRSRCWRRRGRCRGRSRARRRFCARGRTPSSFSCGKRGAREAEEPDARTRPARAPTEIEHHLVEHAAAAARGRSARIERSQVARRRSSWRPVSRPCRRSSVPRHLPTIAIPIGSPISTSRYGPARRARGVRDLRGEVDQAERDADPHHDRADGHQQHQQHGGR